MQRRMILNLVHYFSAGQTSLAWTFISHILVFYFPPTCMQRHISSETNPFIGTFLVLQTLWSPNNVRQKIQKAINNTHTTAQ